MFGYEYPYGYEYGRIFPRGAMRSSNFTSRKRPLFSFVPAPSACFVGRGSRSMKPLLQARGLRNTFTPLQRELRRQSTTKTKEKHGTGAACAQRARERAGAGRPRPAPARSRATPFSDAQKRREP